MKTLSIDTLLVDALKIMTLGDLITLLGNAAGAMISIFLFCSLVVFIVHGGCKAVTELLEYFTDWLRKKRGIPFRNVPVVPRLYSDTSAAGNDKEDVD